jgi:hypothetical protein
MTASIVLVEETTRLSTMAVYGAQPASVLAENDH